VSLRRIKEGRLKKEGREDGRREKIQLHPNSKKKCELENTTATTTKNKLNFSFFLSKKMK
jgi:hypothetical protein